jgi:PAS domain S-box-containing protein
MKPRRIPPAAGIRAARPRATARQPAPTQDGYRSIFDNAVVGIFRSTPPGRLIAANPALARIYGYGSAEEMIADLTDIRRQLYVDPQRRDELERLLLEQGSVSRFETQVYRKDGSRIWISVSARAVREAGTVRYYEGTVEDVTEHKRVETELRRQNELLQTIFDHMPCMFNILGPGVKPLIVNKEWTRVLGWTARELEGCDLLGLLYSDPAERRRAQEFVRASGREWGEFQQRVKDGRIVDTAWANFRLSDGTLIGIGQDITERKLGHRTLQARVRQQAAVARLGQRALAGERLDMLVREVPDLVADMLEVEGSGFFRLLPGGRDLLLVAGAGWAPGMVGRSRIPARRTMAGYALAVKTPFTILDIREDRRFRASLLRDQAAVSAAAALIGDPAHPYGVLNAFSRRQRPFSEDDLHFLQATANVLAAAFLRTEREEIRHHLLQRVMSAQEEERRRIARELHDHTGQAVTSLLVRLRALEDSRTMRQAVSRAAGLRRLAAGTIDDLGRLARGLSPSVLENLGLRPALERLASEESAALGIAVDLDARGLRSARLPGEVGIALYRIAQEAVTNAGKHAAARRIAIALVHQNGQVRLVVRDDGRGFDVESTLRASAGNGRLGVHGMRERAILLGGTLQIESRRGAGTKVSVSVPVGRKRHLRPAPGPAGRAS